MSNPFSLRLRARVSEFQEGPPLRRCRTAGSGRMAKRKEEGEVKPAVRNVQFC